MISLIAAMARNRVIGQGGALPWNLPDDLQRFKRLTVGHTVIMGRKTYESIGHPLPGRSNIVVSRQADCSAPGCILVRDLGCALRNETSDEDEVFIIRGAEICRQALPIADRIYLTTVHPEICGDTRFPEFSMDEFTEIESESVEGADPHTFPSLSASKSQVAPGRSRARGCRL
jgi:dihydrofolate reductase